MALRISRAASSLISSEACSLYQAACGVQIRLGASFSGPWLKLANVVVVFVEAAVQRDAVGVEEQVLRREIQGEVPRIKSIKSKTRVRRVGLESYERCYSPSPMSPSVSPRILAAPDATSRICSTLWTRVPSRSAWA
ncbi:hypothetical protein EYF80_013836 [Liparis tanakae]|uniref:Uncharacterized protein n=1 Tax=Liparis tanakae TaxID=230148 RepID=A0A4Z2ID44_9TELE|nr:hypothetical protein EYF80_013836 [Liparis tanakae]